MSTVKRVRFENGDNGARVATITEVDAAAFARQEAEERQRRDAKQAEAARAARSRVRYEQTRDWLVRQVEITMAHVEGRAHTVELYHFSGEGKRQPNDYERYLSRIIVHRATRAFSEPAPQQDTLLRSLPPGPAGDMTRVIVGFVDVLVANKKADAIRRISTSQGEPVRARAAVTGDGVPLGSYRFVWTQGAHYDRGDVVTDRGASWICVAAGSPARPGKSPAWKLMDKGDLWSRPATVEQ